MIEVLLPAGLAVCAAFNVVPCTTVKLFAQSTDWLDCSILPRMGPGLPVR